MIQFLDVQLRIVRTDSTASLHYCPFTKPTSHALPLSVTSSHTPAVHLSWPRAELRRLRSLCDSSTTFEVHRRRFIDKLIRANFPKVITDDLELPPTRNPKAEHSTLPVSGRQRLWLVLPFHPIWSRANLTRACDDITLNYQHHQLLCVGTSQWIQPITVGIAWRNAGISLM